MGEGNTGKILRVDLTHRTTIVEKLDEALYRLYPGGKALAVRADVSDASAVDKLFVAYLALLGFIGIDTSAEVRIEGLESEPQALPGLVKQLLRRQVDLEAELLYYRRRYGPPHEICFPRR